MSRNTWLVALLVMAPSTCLAASPAGGGRLALRDALDLAVRHRPLLDGARFRTEEVRARRRGVAGGSLPQLDAQAVRVGVLSGAKGAGLQTAGVVSSQLVRDNAAGLNLSQRIYDSGEIRKRKSALVHQIESARADEVVSLQQVALQVVAAFVEVQKQESLLALARQVLEQRSPFVAQVGSWVGAGLRSGVDVKLAMVQETRTRSLVSIARTRRDQAWASLRRAMGSPPALPDRLVPIDLPPPAAPDDARPATSVLAPRPEVVAAREAESAAAFETAAVRATRHPQVVGFVSAGAVNTPEPGGDLEWAGGIAVKVPIDVSQVYHERERQARWRAQQARALRVESEEQVKLEVEQARAEHGNLLAQQQFAVDEIEAARAALRVADAQYLAGLGSFFDRLSAENALLEARTRFESAGFDLFVARVRLEVARGLSAAEAVEAASRRSSAGR
ncbi:MAG: TolC family protein [Candidatus Riflebacteria bacterium]|nr:TolC family protein [Candidatus Riflebacteria bacterium]